MVHQLALFLDYLGGTQSHHQVLSKVEEGGKRQYQSKVMQERRGWSLLALETEGGHQPRGVDRGSLWKLEIGSPSRLPSPPGKEYSPADTLTFRLLGP